MHKREVMAQANGSTQPELRPLEELAAEVVRQCHEFSEFHFLFYGPEARIDLLNAVAKHFFGELFEMMLDHLVLGVSKLTDPPGSGSKTNLSLEFVQSELENDVRYPKVEADKLIARAKSVRRQLATWRSKRIAHNDAFVALGRGDAGKVVPARIGVFLRVAERYVNLVQERFGLGPFSMRTPGIHGADELVKALKSAMAFEQLFEADPMTHSAHLDRSRYKHA